MEHVHPPFPTNQFLGSILNDGRKYHFVVQLEENWAVKECKAVDLHCFTTWAKGKYAVVNCPVRFLHFFNPVFVFNIIFRVLSMLLMYWCCHVLLLKPVTRCYCMDFNMWGDACRSILGASRGHISRKSRFILHMCAHSFLYDEINIEECFCYICWIFIGLF